MFRKLLPLCYALLLLITAGAVTAQYTPDSDGDGLADDLDLCMNEPGPTEQIGCPTEAYATFGDFDLDSVIDPLDACFDLPGDPANAGCPADLDFDGILDAADRCPRFSGVPENNGCPADADGDFVPDLGDTCPAQPGTFANLGCPDGITPPDGDGDTVADLFDQCPTAAGSGSSTGCPDTDGDDLTDNLDRCPGAAGDPNLLGCVAVTTAALPDVVDRINTTTAARVREAGRLTVGQPTIAVSGFRQGFLTAALSFVGFFGGVGFLASGLGGCWAFPVMSTTTAAPVTSRDFPRRMISNPMAIRMSGQKRSNMLKASPGK